MPVPVDHQQEVDALIVGAGFAGVHMLWKLRSIGLDARLVEAEADVGGCWYANRYPGARCDVESPAYSYSFSPEIEAEWHWSERYPPQGEIQRYLAFVADRLDLRPLMAFDRRVSSAVYDEAGLRWTVACEDGARYRARYFILATGPLTVPRMPDIPGLDAFEGTLLHTARWPKAGFDLSGKRVGLVGIGSSGTQFVPAAAAQAAELHVFVRTPNYVMPANNHPLTEAHRAYWREHGAELRRMCRTGEVGGGGDVLTYQKLKKDRFSDASQLTPEQRDAVMEGCWQAGGPAPLIFAFQNVAGDAAVNALVSDFIRRKIAAVIEDPELRETLTPVGYPFLAKRPCAGDNFYESFNRPNVHAVNVRKNPIRSITRRGVKLEDGEIELDVLVMASGFDALTGAITAIDVRGRDDVALNDVWHAGPRSLLGVAVKGFPNMFILCGPLSPSVLTNVVASNEFQVDYLGALIEAAEKDGPATIEADAEAEQQWVDHARELADQTLYDEADSWYVGANVPGKPRVVLPYTGGSTAYMDACEAISANDYRGFTIARQ